MNDFETDDKIQENIPKNIEYKQKAKAAAIAAAVQLLFAEGLAISTLIHGRICLVGTHQDPVQGAVVLGIAMVSTLLYSTLDTLVCVTIHGSCLLYQ